MATDPIDYMVAYYGKSAWKDIVIRWNGTGTQWDLYQQGETQPLYQGPNRQYQFTAQPSTQYVFTVKTTVDGKEYEYSVLTYTTGLPAPIAVTTQLVTSTSARIGWEPTDGVDYYEICDVRNSYSTVGRTISGLSTTYDLSSLTPTTLYSYAVRSVYGEQKSRWSSAATFFTLAPEHVTPGVYEFAPTATYTWRAGRPGSTDPSWAPAQSSWFHGDGIAWGDLNGVQTTYFFFGTSNPFGRLSGATVTKCEIYLDRGQFGGDPGPVLSRVGLHNYPEKPDSEPTPTGSSVDVGTLNRGEAAWFEVPTSWAEQLIIGAYAVGWFWGDCQERYQAAKNVDASVSPRIGMLRITVG